jgi:hypothetical protein
MDSAGLGAKFKFNRALTEQERQYHLKQGCPTGVPPHHQMSVIRMNSTYLEMVDKWYAAKGTVTLYSSAVILVAIFTLGLIFIDPAPEVNTNSSVSREAVLIYIGLLLVPLFGFALWVMSRESFRYTHYPMRFNRKSSTVHVFQPDGTALSVPWRKIYFTLAQVDPLYRYWNILGHILDDDGLVVTNSFALSVSETGTPAGLKVLQSHWEFVRMFMENGPEAVSGQVAFCLPIAERKERVDVGIHLLLAHASAGEGILFPIRSLSIMIALLVFPFRVLAIRSSKIPQWPRDIERECAIETNDPYAIEGLPNADRVPVFPVAAAAAGVQFNGPPANPLVNLEQVSLAETTVRQPALRSKSKKR